MLNEGEEREEGGLEGDSDWEGGGEEGTVLVGLKKNQKVKVKPKKLFFSNHQI